MLVREGLSTVLCRTQALALLHLRLAKTNDGMLFILAAGVVLYLDRQ